MDGVNQLVTVADEGHFLELGEAPQVFYARVILRHFELKAAGVIGVLQVFAVELLIIGLHLVGMVDETGKQGQIRGFLTDFLGKQPVFLGTVGILLNDLPPACDRLAVGERFRIIIPEAWDA